MDRNTPHNEKDPAFIDKGHLPKKDQGGGTASFGGDERAGYNGTKDGIDPATGKPWAVDSDENVRDAKRNRELEEKRL